MSRGHAHYATRIHRQRLLAALRPGEPGPCVAELAREAGVPKWVAWYNLRRLEREGVVRLEPAGRIGGRVLRSVVLTKVKA